MKNTALIVTTDCGDANDVHPTHKQPVGVRLALAASGPAYHQKIEYSGPMLKTFRVNKDSVTLIFDHAKGLHAKDNGTLAGFTIAGEDKQFVPAEAVIRGDKVIVHSSAVSKPVAVRYWLGKCARL